jgi:hypothetical protein
VISTASRPATPKPAKPRVRGTVVPSNSWPIQKPNSAPPMVVMKPCTEAAVPARWPSGSMAIEPKFDITRPKQNIIPACSSEKVHRVS